MTILRRSHYCGLTTANNHHDRSGKYTGGTSASNSSANDESGTTLRSGTYERSRHKKVSGVSSFQPVATHPSSKMPMVMRKTTLIYEVSACVEHNCIRPTYIKLSINPSKAGLQCGSGEQVCRAIPDDISNQSRWVRS
jgi:hypothetical protein